jgi:hypothetical protein
MELPKKERTFYFKHTGDSGFVYEGNFTIKCRLGVAERYAMELEKSRLLADMANPTNGLLGTSVALSTLRTKIVDSPEWWRQGLGLGMEDEDALFALYDKVEKETDSWRKELQKSAKAKEKKKEPEAEQDGADEELGK